MLVSHGDIDLIWACVLLIAPTICVSHFSPPFLLCVLQMILDKTFAGTLDQGAGCLEVFELPTVDAVYPATLDIVESMGRVVDTLFARSQKVMA